MVCMFVPDWMLGTTKIMLYGIVVSILTFLTILLGMRVSIRNNWDLYRCNPLILPFAGLFGYDPSQTFTECLSTNVKEASEPVVKPYDDLFSVLQSTAGNMSNSLGDIRGAMANMKDDFVNGISSVLTKMGNVGATAQFMMLKIQAIFEKLLALYVTLLYFAWSMMKGLESMLKDPILGESQQVMEQAVGFLANPGDLLGNLGEGIKDAANAVGKGIKSGAKKTGKSIKKRFK